MPDEPDKNAISDDAVPDSAVSEGDTGSPHSQRGGVVERATIASRHPDPTRYGDWEKGGRCIDF
ncbi:MAG TPA: DUF1674 domain-containing protein [Woeseiaceae bacterium]|nr:DUF1674 domain-containing protein [Woeseiaceae bacterium]